MTPFLVISIDIVDVSGDLQSDVQNDVYKQRIDRHGIDIVGDSPVKQGIYGKWNIMVTFLVVNVNQSSSTTAVDAAPEPTQPKCGSCYGAERHPQEWVLIIWISRVTHEYVQLLQHMSGGARSISTTQLAVDRHWTRCAVQIGHMDTNDGGT